MFERLLMRLAGIVLGAGLAIVLSTSPVSASTNFLTNPGAESSGTGWTTMLNGGDGMSYNFDGVVRSGTQSFQTSYGLDSIYQRVDLFANGYTTSTMLSSPAIDFSIWYRSRPDQAGRYYVKFALLQQDGSTVVTSTNFGSPDALISVVAGIDWTEVRYTFSNYGAGIRYAYLEFGGQDQSGWGGNYGTHFDDASISISLSPTAITRSLDTGGNVMPSWGYVPPKGPFVIGVRGGTQTVKTTDVLLDIAVSSDVDRMAFSRYSDFRGSGIQPISSSLTWSVCGAPSCAPDVYDVYAKFYQSYGLATPVQHLVINYEPYEVALPVPDVSFTSVVTSSLEKTVAASTTPSFLRNLRQGDRGDDVLRLQQFLNTHGFILAKAGNGSIGNETIVFGPALKRALTRFQEAYISELLPPFGLKNGTGIFREKTRELVNEML